MTYWALNSFFLAVVAAVGIVAVVSLARRRSASLRRTLGAGAIGLGVLLVMTAVFDNVMIAVGLVAYAPDRISGAFIGIAPVEDFAYAIAAAVLLPSLWVLLEPRARTSEEGPR
ncbi:lycopene cyclase domain-containing protein [Cnuibacter sp. UC19_7]|uniref:lycopene cyclase domain-containing protein n=1 Tax=Cnuibacter sp. UC19_7 TaxID=3350166 RepID=UPI00366CF480